MFKTFVLLSVIVAALCPAAFGQELYGGYQFEHFGEDVNGHGFNVAVNGPSDRWVTYAGEFGSSFDSESFTEAGTQVSGNARFLTFRGGPRFVSTANPKLRPFVHALFGFTNSRFSFTTPSTSVSDSANGFSMALGGGADFKIASKLAIRAQLDYMHMGNVTVLDTDLGSTNGYRFTTGLVYRFR